MGVEVRRVTVELPIPSWNKLCWCQREVGATTVVEVVRHAIMAYEKELKAQRAAEEYTQHAHICG